MKTKLILTRFGATFGVLRFHERPFSNTLLKFPAFWDFKPTSAIDAYSPGVYTSDKSINLSTIDKILLKCDVIDGSVANGVRAPIRFSFIIDRPSGYKLVCEHETIHFEKIIKSVLNTITIFLKDDNREEVNFYGETLTFTLQMNKN